MPKALRPGNRYTITLESDRHLPESERPVFYATATTCEQQMELVEKWDAIKRNAPEISTRDQYAATLDLLGTLIVGWDNMGDHKFSPRALGKVLDITEATELLASAIWNNHLDTEEKKSSAPQP